jgi:hypothetical protein
LIFIYQKSKVNTLTFSLFSFWGILFNMMTNAPSSVYSMRKTEFYFKIFSHFLKALSDLTFTPNRKYFWIFFTHSWKSFNYYIRFVLHYRLMTTRNWANGLVSASSTRTARPDVLSVAAVLLSPLGARRTKVTST